MSWLDNYRQASFRGVEFYVPGHEVSGGRRIQVTEFPGRDESHVEDLGRKSKKFSIEGYVIGDDYDIQRDKLIKALDKKGPGKLVHPYHGDIQVITQEFSYRDTVQEMNLARFTITFVEAGLIEFPIKTINSVSKVALAKAGALTAMKEGFQKVWNISKKSRSFADAAISTIERGLNYLESAKSTVSSVADFRARIESMLFKVEAIAYDAKELVENITDLISFGTDEEDDVTADSAKKGFEDMKALNNLEPDIINGGEDEPAIIFAKMYSDSAIITQTALLSIIEFESKDEAEEFRNYVFGRLDAIAEATEDDDVYTSLYILRTSVAEHLDLYARTLPQTSSFTPIITLPALLISYDLYGTIDKEQEIIKRNAISHPGFVTGSVPIEVLLNVG